MFNDLTSLPAYLSSRRSGRARDLVAPGPDAAALQEILAIAARTPDHGKLAPWRFITIDNEDRPAFGDLLRTAFLKANPDAREVQIDAAVAISQMAPTLVIMLYAPQPSSKIPEWEQMLSAGAAAMNLLHASHAHGFAGSWITGWAAYDETVREALCKDDERIAGFMFMGTPANPLQERPRPGLQDIVRPFKYPAA